MIKNILVPIDMAHAERGATMINQAREMFGDKGGDITLLHVVQEIPAYVRAEMPSDLDDKAITDSKAHLQNLIENYNLPETTKIKVRQGNPFHEILAEAKESGTDLIVIASHQPGITDYLLGSVAGQVVRHSKCSVLVLR
ncbi:MAG: universal stress protein [Rhizobiaceae bacterium]|nr:universal stress protein [Rhizobiaceae bacterium]